MPGNQRPLYPTTINLHSIPENLNLLATCPDIASEPSAAYVAYHCISDVDQTLSTGRVSFYLNVSYRLQFRYARMVMDGKVKGTVAAT